MIHDFVVELEDAFEDAVDGVDYVCEHFDDYDDALTYYETHYDKWTYASLKKRVMDPITMKDVYEHIFTYEQ